MIPRTRSVDPDPNGSESAKRVHASAKERKRIVDAWCSFELVLRA